MDIICIIVTQSDGNIISVDTHCELKSGAKFIKSAEDKFKSKLSEYEIPNHDDCLENGYGESPNGMFNVFINWS